MLNFNVTFQREFTVQIEADSIKTAEVTARNILAQFPKDSCKLTSVAKDEATRRVPAAKPKRQRATRCAADEWLEPDER